MASKGEGSIGAARDTEGFTTYKVGVDEGGKLGRIAVASGRNHTIMFGGRGHDEYKAMILLCSLPPSYEHMVTTLTYEKVTIKVEEIIAALLAHNQRKQNAGECSQADSLYVKGNRDRGRNPEKAGSGKRNFRSKSGDKKRDCSKLKKQTDEKRDDSSKSVNVVEDDNSDCSEGDMLSISTTQLTDAWILDSGSSYHITPNREWFSKYKSVDSGFVYLGEDQCCNIVGIGDIRIKMYDGSFRTLCGVRHIPDLKKNLISFGTLHKNDFIPKADEYRETIRIVKGAFTVMKGKMTAGNIYRLLGYHFTVDLEDYSLARDKVIQTNIKHPNRLSFEGLVSFSLTVSSDHLVTFHDAVTSQENDKWMAAMVEEMDSLNHNCTWELVHLPEEEQIYMQQLEGFIQLGNEHLVCRLKKSLYGLKQSPIQWYKRFDSYMIKIGYKRREYDCCVYVKSLDDGSFIFLLLYRDSRKLWLSQRVYVEKMLERFVMSSAKPVSPPLANHFKLSSEQCPKTDKEAEDMAKYMSKPGKQHWEVVKWIFRCLKGTMGYGIVFGTQRDNPLVVGYVDSDYASDLDNRRSTTGTTEVEYMAVTEATKEALWLTGLVKELGVQ
ncbi:hypothetical protein F3Y22_tig00017599pilonHSYRG00003 [Hibiscus syriacus]|uniref:Uncharacterized protein n=1 Tax=Hibiscus syriacus TaxID=106335 RepID=A0A6A3BW77_HIBSY|nr:hypothetical protein F3Y22_tig00017599pilonHSYRG00003 [Hibiscus syriacus]